MSDHDGEDVYTEVEYYLRQAQDEIGRAVDDLYTARHPLRGARGNSINEDNSELVSHSQHARRIFNWTASCRQEIDRMIKLVDSQPNDSTRIRHCTCSNFKSVKNLTVPVACLKEELTRYKLKCFNKQTCPLLKQKIGSKQTPDLLQALPATTSKCSETSCSDYGRMRSWSQESSTNSFDSEMQLEEDVFLQRRRNRPNKDIATVDFFPKKNFKFSSPTYCAMIDSSKGSTSSSQDLQIGGSMPASCSSSDISPNLDDSNNPKFLKKGELQLDFIIRTLNALSPPPVSQSEMELSKAKDAVTQTTPLPSRSCSSCNLSFESLLSSCSPKSESLSPAEDREDSLSLCSFSSIKSCENCTSEEFDWTLHNLSMCSSINSTLSFSASLSELSHTSSVSSISYLYDTVIRRPTQTSTQENNSDIDVSFSDNEEFEAKDPSLMLTKGPFLSKVICLSIPDESITSATTDKDLHYYSQSNTLVLKPKASSYPMCHVRTASKNHYPIDAHVIIDNTRPIMSAPVLTLSIADACAAENPEYEKRKTSTVSQESRLDLRELKAQEACEWLRATGFPQYAHMYEEHLFPIDTDSVRQDHAFLDPDSLQSLFRRLNTLNKCAKMKINEALPPGSDSDEEENQYALSTNWAFERDSRRWSRVPPHIPSPPLQAAADQSAGITKSTSCETLPKDPTTPLGSKDESGTFRGLRRSGSDRLRDGAKAFMRRVEHLKGKKKRRLTQEGNIVIGEPHEMVHLSSGTALPIDPSPSSSLSSSPQLLRTDSSSATSGDSPRPPRVLTSQSTSHLDFASRLFLKPPYLQNGHLPALNLGGARKNEDMKQTLIKKSKTLPTLPKFKLKDDELVWSSVKCGKSQYLESNVLISSLSATQLVVLKKFSMLKLTSLMERHCPSSKTGWNWAIPKFIRRMKPPDYKDKIVFGIPLSLVHQRTGYPLPPSIQDAINYLRKTSLDCVGIFRKSGVRSRIQKLRSMNETNPEKMNYCDHQAYDVADMLKQYFRELPEALLTTKLSETFISIFQFVPEAQRFEALQAAVILLPDENREVLETLLSFLHEVSNHVTENQMTATNLAVCFAPSLFHQTLSQRSISSSPRRHRTLGVPDPQELNENKAAYECLTRMIIEGHGLFMVTIDPLHECPQADGDLYEPAIIENLSMRFGDSTWEDYLEQCYQTVLRESREKFKTWTSINVNNADMAYKKVGDGHPLRLWKVSVEIEAPPIEVLNRILRERHKWDVSFMYAKTLAHLNSQTEIVQSIHCSLPPQPSREYCLLRSWRSDKRICMLTECSVNYSRHQSLLGTIKGVVLASRYLIEPGGSGKSKVTHIIRVDSRGKSIEWYNKMQGYVNLVSLTRLQNSFSQHAAGPETKV